MVQAINPNRIVPVQEDLATPYSVFEIIRGWEKMHRVDKEIADGVSLAQGEWAVLGNNNKLTRPTASPVPNTYLVIAGTDRFDVAATGQATIIMASKVIVRTTRYNDGVSYNVGDYLTVKNLGAGEAYVTLAGGSDPRLAKVVEVGSDYLVYETV
jgi:hypothetical protein